LVEREEYIRQLEASLGGGGNVLLSTGGVGDTKGGSIVTSISARQRDFRYVTKRGDRETDEEIREKAAAAYFPGA
jgi:hypothetical protein